MIALVRDKQDALLWLCARYRVKRLGLFGSATGEDFDPAHSDLDFMVEFLPLQPGEHAPAYFGLLAGLEDLFQRPIDLGYDRSGAESLFPGGH